MVKTKIARKNPGHVGPKTKKLVVVKRAKPWKVKVRRLSPDSDDEGAKSAKPRKLKVRRLSPDSDDEGACPTGKKTVSFSTKAGPVSFCASTKPKKRTASKFVAMRKPRKKDYGKRVRQQLVDESGETLFMTDERDPWGLRS